MTGIPFPPGADEDTPVFVISVAALRNPGMSGRIRK